MRGTVDDDGSLTLRLRLIACGEHGKYLEVSGSSTATSRLAALESKNTSAFRARGAGGGTRAWARLSCSSGMGRAIFVDMMGATDQRRGAIGVDLNATTWRYRRRMVMATG